MADTTDAAATPKPAAEIHAGVGFAAGAYFLWGLFPAFFKLLQHVPAAEILLHRMLWSAPSITIFVLLTGRWSLFLSVLKDRKAVLTLLGTALLLSVNWLVYIYAVNSDRIIESSLGYFINPIVSVFLGLVVLKERLLPMQWVAVGLACTGVVHQSLALGALPWIPLTLAGTFALYGLLRKTVAADSRTGLMVETLAMTPVAVLALGWMHGQGAGAFAALDAGTIALLAATGPVTVLPLLLFAMGARRLKLSTMGFLQYIGPSLQLMTGLLYGEDFTMTHAITFGLIWTALGVFSISTLRAR